MIETLPPNPADSRPLAADDGETVDHEAEVPNGRWRGFPPAPLVALAVVVLVLGWSYAPSIRSLVMTWKQEPNYTHGFLVVPVALVILWKRWTDEEKPRPAIEPWRWGWAALVVVLALRAIFYERGSEWSETATILPVIACVTLMIGGWSLLGRVWPAIAFLAFFLPLPDRVDDLLAMPLQRLATDGSCVLLKLTGLWAVAEGNVILLGADPLEVAAACNGLSMLMCLAATVVAMTLLVEMRNWKRFVLLASIIPIALMSNILRITATAWCYHLFGAEVGGHFAHDAAGWLMMPVALILVGLELGLLSWLIIEVDEKPVTRSDRLLLRRPT